MKRIAITGQNGFIGSHLYRKAMCSEDFECVDFPRDLFEHPERMRRVVKKLDAVIHLAGLSRHSDGDYLYQTNVTLTRALAEACTGEQMIYLASTTHEQKDLPYHQSKRACRKILEQRGKCGILLMANTFGAGSKPFYNSVVSTFCVLAANGKKPAKVDPVTLSLIAVDDLCREILRAVQECRSGDIVIPHTFEIPLPELWDKLQLWQSTETPFLKDKNEAALYAAYLSYQK